jgi:hypothetical protein
MAEVSNTKAFEIKNKRRPNTIIWIYIKINKFILVGICYVFYLFIYLKSVGICYAKPIFILGGAIDHKNELNDILFIESLGQFGDQV